MKGHATIELTDVKTGKKEIYEEDNIVTNGLQNFLGIARQLYSITSDTNNFMFPVYRNALGGIMLFSQPIVESAESTRIPDTFTGNSIVGYSAYSTDGTSDTKRGTLNITETEIGEKVVKYVYDFGTDKANGIIQCISLCPSNYGLSGTPNVRGGGLIDQIIYTKDGAITERIGELVKFDFLSGKGYSVKKVGNNVSIYEVTLNGYMKNVNFKKYSMTEELITTVENIEELSGGNETYFGGAGDYIYGFRNNDYTVHCFKIRISTHEWEHSTIESKYYGGINTVLGIKNEHVYLWRRSGSYYNIFRMNMETGEEKKLLENDIGSYASCDIFMQENGDMYINGRVFPVDDSGEYGSAYNPSNEFRYKCIVNNGFAIMPVRVNGRPSIMPSYDILATVNNLATPVRKTAAQTMKITYTLTME